MAARCESVAYAAGRVAQGRLAGSWKAAGALLSNWRAAYTSAEQAWQAVGNERLARCALLSRCAGALLRCVIVEHPVKHLRTWGWGRS